MELNGFISGLIYHLYRNKNKVKGHPLSLSFKNLLKHLFSDRLERFAPVLSPEKTKKSLHSSSFLYYHPFLREGNFLSSLQLPHGANLLSLDQMEQRDFMLIHIRRRDNKCKETQVAVYEMLVKILFTISKACYRDNKPVFRILCGSI